MLTVKKSAQKAVVRQMSDTVDLIVSIFATWRYAEAKANHLSKEVIEDLFESDVKVFTKLFNEMLKNAFEDVHQANHLAFLFAHNYAKMALEEIEDEK